MFFLHSSFHMDLVNPVLSFSTNLSMNALRLVDKNHQKLVESSPHFSETSKKVIQGVRQFLENQEKYKKFSKIDISFANLFNFRQEFRLATNLFKSVFPVVNNVLTLKEEIKEGSEDYPLSILFGTRSEFEKLPTMTVLWNRNRTIPDLSRWAGPIVRCEVLFPDSVEEISKKTLLLVRGKADQGSIARIYVHFPKSKTWDSLSTIKEKISNAYLPLSLTDENGKRTAAYNDLQKSLIEKKFVYRGNTYNIE